MKAHIRLIPKDSAVREVSGVWEVGDDDVSLEEGLASAFAFITADNLQAVGADGDSIHILLQDVRRVVLEVEL